MKRALGLHGHMGPFLAIGARMGIIGLKKLDVREGDTKLLVTAMLKYAVPFSCLLDGIQAATKCTVGNKRLEWKESKEIRAVFTLTNKGKKVEIKVHPAVVQELKRRLEKTQPSDEETRQLALEVFSRPEKELFLINKNW